MSARERVVRPAHISESLQVKMVHAIEDTKELNFRYLICPYCKHPVMRVYSDATGHIGGKCKKCGRITIFDVMNMRRVSPFKHSVYPIYWRY